MRSQAPKRDPQHPRDYKFMDDSLKQVCNDILSYDENLLKRKQGDFQFTDVEKEIDGVMDFVRDLSQNEDFYNILPDTEQNSLRGRIQAVQNTFSQISNFAPASIANPQDIRNALAEQVREIYRNLFSNIIQLEIFRLRSKGAQGKLANIITEAKNVVKDAKGAQQQIADLLDAAKKTTSQVSLYEYLGIFKKVSSKYKRIAYVWLGVSGVFTIILLLLLFIIGNDLSKIIQNLQSSQAIIAIVIVKLFFIAIAVYVLQQCIRNYMANMHQGVLNEQRENSLKVFDAMVKSTSAPETTDQVLSYLAKSIFDSGETGFFPGKDISKDGPDLIQIFKDIGKPK